MVLQSILTELIGAFLSPATYAPMIAVAGNLSTEIIDMNNNFTTSLFNNNVVISFIAFITTVGGILFIFGIGFAFSEWAIDCNEIGNSNNIMATFKNCIIGFAALSGFATLPILLLKWINELANILCSALSGINMSNTMQSAWNNIANMNFFSGWGAPTFALLIVICIIRIFLANIKRGGIMISLITVGSLHMFSIPRGYTDAFWSWCKQVIGLCMTSFLQNLLLILGIVVYSNSSMTPFDLILGAGVMLSATEVPRILQQFGLDTSMKTNVSQAIFGVSGIMNIASAFMR